MSKNTVLSSLKWIFAIGLIVILIKSGKISLTDVQVFLSHPFSALACLGLVATVYTLAFTRWRLLLLSQGIEVRFWTVVKLGMLGQFFSSIIPGTTGGDLVKAVYVARRYPDRKVKTVTTIFLDRFLGLFGLICAGALFFLLGRSQLAQIQNKIVPLLESLGWLLVVGASTILTILIFFPKIGKFLPQETPRIILKMPGRSFFENLYQSALSYRNKIKFIWASLGISVLIHLLNAGNLYFIAHTIFGPPPWGMVNPYLFIMGSVLGTCAIAVPVAPQGLGIGQLAFAAIFAGLGAPSDTFGTSLITSFQIVSLMLNLTGLFFYATYRHETESAPTEILV